jgi:hypothetical protein
MARILPKDQTAKGYYTERYVRGQQAQSEHAQKLIKQGKVCPVHHFVLNEKGMCPMCGFDYQNGGTR